MKLDRELQRKILEELAENYPNCTVLKGESSNSFAPPNLFYLREHQLIDNCVTRETRKDGVTQTFSGLKITAKGMDFLADDGGLSAILGTVTVKFHEDTIRALIEKKVMDSSDLAPDDKTVLLSQLRSLPGESIKHLTMKLLDKGLGNLPSAGTLIQTSLNYLGIS